MRVLSVTPYYEPEGGGLERYAHEMTRRFVDAGHEVLAVAATRIGLPDEDRDGVRITRWAPRFFVGNAPVDPLLQKDFVKKIRSFSPHVVAAHTPVPYPAEMAYRAARAEGVPFVLTYHAGRLRGSNPALQGLARLDSWALQRPMLEGSRCLVAVSPYVRKNALRRHQDRVTVVPPGVDSDLFAPGPREGPNRRVLFVGPLCRTYQWKGVDVLWRAFKRVSRHYPDARLVLIGEGGRRQKFIKQAREQGISLYAPGRLDERSLVEEYRRADTVVLPSTRDAESFGMVLAEANACGRPVVASNIGGMPDFVRHGDNGLLVPPGDPDALARAIERMFTDPEEADRMGERGRQRVVREHDWGLLSRRMLRVLELAAAGDEDRLRVVQDEHRLRASTDPANTAKVTRTKATGGPGVSSGSGSTSRSSSSSSHQ